MSRTSNPAVERAPDRTERVQRWVAALVTALLHMLLVLLVMPPPPIAITTSQSAAGGSRINVSLIDETLPPSPPEPVPPHKPISPKKPKAVHAVKRAVSTPIVQAAGTVPPQAPDTSDTSTVTTATEPESTDAPREPADTDRPAHAWGQPPGMRTDDAARANAALAAKLGSGRGSSNNAPPVGPNMELDGFHVYYELVNEIRLREWRDQGMTELFLPLPGTRRLMVCPLEVALRRGSSACRMVEFDSPELKSIGDARDVINVQKVYQLGDEVWSGPGPYR